MQAPHDGFIVQVGERSRDFQDAVIASGGELQLLCGVAQKLEAGCVWFGAFFDECRGAACIGADALEAGGCEAFFLHLAGTRNAAGDVGAGFGCHGSDKVCGRDGGNFDPDIDAIH